MNQKYLFKRLHYLEGKYAYLVVIWHKDEEIFFLERMCVRDDDPNGGNNENSPQNSSEPRTGTFS